MDRRTINLAGWLPMATLCAVAGLAACDDSSSSDGEDSSSSATSSSSGGSSVSSSSAESFAYVIDTVMVDYKGDHKVAFLDFSSGTVTHVDYDAWDIAISTEDGSVICNCGDWGTGVRIFRTTDTRIAEDFSPFADSITQIVSASGNPFAGEFDAQGAGTGLVYLVKDAVGESYKVRFTSYGPMGRFVLQVADGLDGSASEFSGYISGDQDYTYLDLGNREDVSTQFPAKEDWDVKFARSFEFDMGGLLSAVSAITFNAAQGVEVASVDGKDIGEVNSAAGLVFDSDRAAIGSSWYAFDHNTLSYSLNPVTYVFRTVEGNYGKLQMRSFYGPNQEQFWSVVKFGYQPDGSGAFPQ